MRGLVSLCNQPVALLSLIVVLPSRCRAEDFPFATAKSVVLYGRSVRYDAGVAALPMTALFPFTPDLFAPGVSPSLVQPQVVMQRLSFAGELGWEVYVDQEQAHDVFTMIRAAGREQGVGLELCGTHSLVGLRMEKGFLSWGHDVTTGESPLDVGLGTFVDMKKEAFVGRDAYQQYVWLACAWSRARCSSEVLTPCGSL